MLIQKPTCCTEIQGYKIALFDPTCCDEKQKWSLSTQQMQIKISIIQILLIDYSFPIDSFATQLFKTKKTISLDQNLPLSLTGIASILHYREIPVKFLKFSLNLEILTKFSENCGI